MIAAVMPLSVPSSQSVSGAVLVVEHLDIGLRKTNGEARHIVIDANFSIVPGEMLALVGESGSGKTMIARAILRLLPPGVAVQGGAIRYGGEDLAHLAAARLRALRGNAIGMVFQEPMVSLNPALRIGVQMTEALRLHRGLRYDAARKHCLDLLERVRIADPAACLNAYPHQFSGGMRQRIMLASTLAMQPRLLIADEPTTALDAIVQKEVMDIMTQLTREMGTAVLLVSHDLGMVARYAQRVVVLCRGETMEMGETRRVIAEPQHDYTRKLLASLPARGERKFPAPGGTPLVEIRGLDVDFDKPTPFWRKRETFRVVRSVNLDLHAGETLAVVGESGSGKTTIGRALVRLVRESGGSIRFEGRDITNCGKRDLDAYRLKSQMVFQDPYSSLDPRMHLVDIVAEGLRHVAGLSKPERRARATAMLAEVGLTGDFTERFPHELSGGQRQRVSIARAIVAGPRFLVADEAVSALDVTVQKQVLALLESLQKKFGFAYLFITHDLGVVEQVADRVAVIYRGRILEIGSRDAIFGDAHHPYTLRLLRATPRIRRIEGGVGYCLEQHESRLRPPPADHVYFNHGSMSGQALSEGEPVMLAVGPDHYVACVANATETH
ncbi:MAG: ABC transporter ATP-binding protein [Proteobacteria bacterium]|nr:ABC transporter ATP-binding protein [Pseudomonadota bacterium]MBS0568911.1 ABC transporter ATP-binding protein [Pseudomonadota bacterium]